MSALSEIIEKAYVEEGWKKDARTELAAFVKELEANAVATHVLYRDHAKIDAGHQGNFSECPSYSCVKARELIGLRFGMASRSRRVTVLTDDDIEAAKFIAGTSGSPTHASNERSVI